MFLMLDRGVGAESESEREKERELHAVIESLTWVSVCGCEKCEQRRLESFYFHIKV